MHLVRRYWVFGLPAVGFLCGLGPVFAGPLPGAMYVFGLAALVGVVIAFAVGVRQSRFDRPVRRLLSGAVIAGLFVSGFLVPIGAKRIWTEQQVRQLPILADASNRFAFHAIAGGDGYPDYGLYYESKLPAAEAAKILEGEFHRAGWVVSGMQGQGLTGNISYCVRGEARVACQLSVRPESGKTMVHIPAS